jgi:hypothetical protein
VDRPTKEELAFEIDCASQPESTCTNREWFWCARRLAAEVRALREEMGNPPLQRVADEITKAVVESMREETAGLRATVACVKALPAKWLDDVAYQSESVAQCAIDVEAALKGEQ